MANASPVNDAVETEPVQVKMVPEVYIESNKIQRAMGIKILDSPQMSFAIKPSGSQQFIDVGCGTGDFTLQELLPRCQPCRRIVATDISRAMVEYAEENFAHPQIAYEVHDIESDITGLIEKYGKFERVYSFCALQWTADLTTALRNVAGLMTDQGECLLVFPVRLPLFRVWRRIAEIDRWKPYKGVIERFIPPSADIKDMSNLNSYLLGVLKNAKLKPRMCQVVTEDQSGLGLEKNIEFELSLDPVLPLLPEGEKTKYKTDVANVHRTFWTEKPAGDPQYLYDIFAVHASKR
ncbi:juvenile hormone acid O-methyltransferase [Ixodes scapularis]